MNRGGYRETAGRKTSWMSGCKFKDTKLIRIPIVIADKLLRIAHRLDSNESIDSTEELIEKAKLVLSDPKIVRSKDKAMVRRAFAKLLNVDEESFKS